MKLEYKQVKRGSLVTAASVGFLTSSLSPQLILCKQVTVEVWNVEDNDVSVASSIELSLPITCCSVLQAPERTVESASTRDQQYTYLLEALDLLLVVNSEGEVIILQWDANITGLAACSMLQMAAGIDSSAMINETILSKPLFIFDSKVKGFQLESMQQGISIVAICSFEEILQVVCMAWGKNKDKENSSALASTPAAKLGTFQRSACGNLQLHLLKLATERDPHMDIFQSYKAPYILGLSFLGGQTSPHQTRSSSALDYKGRPLLVALSANRGLSQNLLSLECWVVDLSNNQLKPGPWKMSNLHPTTRLLVPWTFETTSELDNGVAQLESISPAKTGVFVISSTSLTFIQVNGERWSLVITLQGLPVCCDVCNNTSLVIADSSSMLYILDVRSRCQFKMQRILCEYPVSIAKVVQCLTLGRASGQQKTILFVYGDGGDAHVFRVLHGEPCEVTFADFSPDSESYMFPKCLGSSTCRETYQEEKETPQTYGPLFDSVAPVNDALLLCNDDYSSNHQLLLACGTALNGTLRKATLAFELRVAEVYDIQMHDLPTIIPISMHHQNVDSNLAVLSYGVRRLPHFEVSLSPATCTSPMVTALMWVACGLGQWQRVVKEDVLEEHGKVQEDVPDADLMKEPMPINEDVQFKVVCGTILMTMLVKVAIECATVVQYVRSLSRKNEAILVVEEEQVCFMAHEEESQIVASSKPSKELRASWVKELTETGISSCGMEGFDAEHRTFAIASFDDKFFVQVTSKSVRVLQFGGPLVSEWLPPADTFGMYAATFPNSPLSITAATMHPEGIVLAVKNKLYSIRVESEGGYHVLGMRLHYCEVMQTFMSISSIGYGLQVANSIRSGR
ncbi:hypothetical protein L7F22_047041 [Adiantum nelumboides]|nr:hypothetical protein [Adiantum nelumboides]